MLCDSLPEGTRPQKFQTNPCKTQDGKDVEAGCNCGHVPV